MKHLFSFTIIVTLLAFSMTSCVIRIKPASEKIIEKTFDLKDFNTIEILSYTDVVYVPGDHYSVKVKAAEPYVDNLDICVQDSLLFIDYSKSMGLVKSSTDVTSDNHKVWHFFTGLQNLKIITVYVTCPKITKVNLSGAGSFTCKNDMHTEGLTLNIGGSGNINLGKTYAKKVNVKVSGSGDVKIDWLSANVVNYAISGSGSINSKEFHSQNSRVDVSGSGDISVNYTDCKQADALISGSGGIYLSGTLETLKENSTGSGFIHKEGLKTKYATKTKDK